MYFLSSLTVSCFLLQLFWIVISKQQGTANTGKNINRKALGESQTHVFSFLYGYLDQVLYQLSDESNCFYILVVITKNRKFFSCVVLKKRKGISLKAIQPYWAHSLVHPSLDKFDREAVGGPRASDLSTAIVMKRNLFENESYFASLPSSFYLEMMPRSVSDLVK